MTTPSTPPTIASLCGAEPSAVPASAGPAVAPGSLVETLDLVLRGQKALSRVLAEEHELPRVIEKLLLLAIAGLLAHGLAIGAAAEYFAATTGAAGLFFGGHPVVWVPPVLVIAFLGALSICLPSFYFHTQLAGLDASFRLVTAQALRAQATTSVLLFGALPVYAAIVLLAVLGVGPRPELVIAVGMFVPFLVGFLGVRAVYRGFGDLLSSIPITHPRRGNFIRRLVLCWGAVYTAIAPVALVRLAATFSGS